MADRSERADIANNRLGKPAPSKTDEFSEKFQRWGGGSFSIQKFMLQIFAIIDDTSVMNFGEKFAI